MNANVRTIYMNQYVSNQMLDLRYLAGIEYGYSGYYVEAVTVELGSQGFGSTMRLLVNGIAQDAVYSPTSYVTLYPRYAMQLDDEISSLVLHVEGQAWIRQIHVHLRPGYLGFPGYNEGNYIPDTGGGQLHLPLEIYERHYDQEALELNQYVDLERYRGYRLIAVEVDVETHFSAAKLSLLIDGMIYGEVYAGGENTLTIFPTYMAIIGEGAENMSLLIHSSDGVVDINGVTLRLSQY